MNVHFMAVPADRMIAVDIPVAVYKILHVTVVLLTTRHDITEIHCFCFNEQCEKFFRYILFFNKMVQMFLPSKKERGPLLGLFMMKYFKLDL